MHAPFVLALPVVLQRGARAAPRPQPSEAHHHFEQRLTEEVNALRALQLEHAKINYRETATRQRDASDLELRVAKLTAQLTEVIEQTNHQRDALYSVLTSGQGGPIKSPATASKKTLKPIKPTKATPVTPRNAKGLFDGVSLPVVP